MTVEITFFKGIAVVIFASIGILTTFYFRVARELESRVEDITIKKAWVIEGDLIKCLFIASSLCTQKMFKLISEKTGEETISELWNILPEQIQNFFRMPQETLVGSIDESAIPKEVIEVIRLRDEERDRLFHLSFLGFALKELLPETVSYEVDKLTKAIICGVIFGLLVPTLDFLLTQSSQQYLLLLGLVTGCILVTGYYYVKDGIMGIWSMRELEKKLRKLNRDKNTDEIGETVEEIVE